jgi:hypothetical protein
LKNLYLWFYVQTIAPVRSWCSRGYSGVGPVRAGSLSTGDFSAGCWERLSVPTGDFLRSLSKSAITRAIVSRYLANGGRGVSSARQTV